MNVLVLGSGGREHTLVWKIRQSARVEKVFALPGNSGMSYNDDDGLAPVDLVPNISLSDTDGLLEFAKSKNVGLVVVGPEDPLVNGISDIFSQSGVKCFGPSAKAAQLEGSKIFAKEILNKACIPTAKAEIFSDEDEAIEFVKNNNPPFVVKADGLAAGKGVFICKDAEEAIFAIRKCMSELAFGEAGKRILVEECLSGRELSFLAFVDGKTILPLEPAQDYKRALDGDRGGNTGGMGSYSPSPLDPALLNKITNEIVRPVVNVLAAEGITYKGLLYTGLMLTGDGPKVLEFNVRFGDPETQAVLPRLKSDIVEVFLATIDGTLDVTTLEWDDRSCVCVVAASGGYPDTYSTGFPIMGLGSIGDDVIIFHAGTARLNNDIATSGGRVLNVCALGSSISKARSSVYGALDKISFEGMHYRKDIAI